MEKYFVLAILVAIAAATTITLALPTENYNHGSSNENNVIVRNRRDIQGVFEAVGRGFAGLAEGAKTVGDSVIAAFGGIFSTNNKNAISGGFDKFASGMKEAFNGLFGPNGEKVKKGVKSVGDKIKGVFNGDGKKGAPPAGGVPAEETT